MAHPVAKSPARDAAALIEGLKRDEQRAVKDHVRGGQQDIRSHLSGLRAELEHRNARRRCRVARLNEVRLAGAVGEEPLHLLVVRGAGVVPRARQQLQILRVRHARAEAGEHLKHPARRRVGGVLKLHDPRITVEVEDAGVCGNGVVE